MPAPLRMGCRRARCAVSLRNLAWHPSVEIQRQLALGVGRNHGARQLLWRWHVPRLQVWRVRQAKSTEPGVPRRATPCRQRGPVYATVPQPQQRFPRGAHLPPPTGRRTVDLIRGPTKRSASEPPSRTDERHTRTERHPASWWVPRLGRHQSALSKASCTSAPHVKCRGPKFAKYLPTVISRCIQKPVAASGSTSARGMATRRDSAHSSANAAACTMWRCRARPGGSPGTLTPARLHQQQEICVPLLNHRPQLRQQVSSMSERGTAVQLPSWEHRC